MQSRNGILGATFLMLSAILVLPKIGCANPQPQKALILDQGLRYQIVAPVGWTINTSDGARLYPHGEEWKSSTVNISVIVSPWNQRDTDYWIKQIAAKGVPIHTDRGRVVQARYFSPNFSPNLIPQGKYYWMNGMLFGTVDFKEGDKLVQMQLWCTKADQDQEGAKTVFQQVVSSYTKIN